MGEGSGQSDIESNTEEAPVGHSAIESDFKGRAMLLVSGSLRVFVQSAALMAIAVYMHDVGYMGYFRQSCAVAILCLIPVPFEGFASGVWLQETFPSLHKYGKRISFMTLVVLAVLSMSTLGFAFEASKQLSTGIFLTELILLQISLAFVAPSNVSRYQHKHVERSLVILE